VTAKPAKIAAVFLVLILAFVAAPRSRAVSFTQDQATQVPAPAATPQSAEREAKAEETSPTEAFKHSSMVKKLAHWTHLSEDEVYWISLVLNFAVIIAILWFALRKVVAATFRGRTEALQKNLAESRKAADEAGQRLTQIEERLSRLHAEIEQMRSEAETIAASEEQRVMAAAEEERRRIVESAEQEIARAAGNARRELKVYAAELAVRLAEQKIRISESADEMLVRRFASRLGKDGN